MNKNYLFVIFLNKNLKRLEFLVAGVYSYEHNLIFIQL